MKRSVLFLIVIFLVTSISSLQQIAGQDKNREEQEKEFRIQKTIEEQKKAMTEQKKAQEEALEELQKAQEEAEKSLKDIDINVVIDDGDTTDLSPGTHGKRIHRNYRFKDPFIGTPIPPGIEPFYNFDYDYSLGEDNESTSWEFSRRVKEKTLKSEYTFDVEKTASSVVMSVMGDCREGEIRIRIIMPGGKTYSDIVIDEFGNLNWRKSFKISETENQDKAGPWKFQINSSKATGYFKISLQTY